MTSLTNMRRRLEARVDPQLSAVLGEPRPLVLERADPRRDLPGHVRAGSSVRRWGERLVVVQDDVHALAVLDEGTGIVTPLALPRGADGRRTFGDELGNKALKMDLEASVVLPDGRLVVLGSGSRPERERVVVADDRGAVLVAGHSLYAHLRSTHEFAGSELNIEGAVVVDGWLRLFQRGNGAPRDGLAPVDAIGDLSLDSFVAWLDGGAPPTLGSVCQVQLGSFDGVRFGFTDATTLPDGRVAFVASAEDSPDAFRDGEVVGCRFGIIDGDDVRMTDIVERDGAPTRVKLEGIDWRGEGEGGGTEHVVVADPDDPETPSTMSILTVREG